MTTLLDLYEYAEDQGIDVDWVPLEQATSLSIPLPDGSYAIAVNPWKLDTLEQETVCLAHELGHCKTGSFYNRHAALDIRQKHENRADKWAIQHLIPVEDLDEAVVEGCEDIPALSEHFCVTEDLMQQGGLLVYARQLGCGDVCLNAPFRLALTCSCLTYGYIIITIFRWFQVLSTNFRCFV